MSNIKIIKPYSRASSNEVSLAGALAKEGRTKVPGAAYSLLPVRDAKNNVITGLDENAISLQRIKDLDALATEKARLKALREELEATLNEDLTPSSAFWNDPEYGKGNDLYYLKDGDNVFDMNNPMDVVNYNWLINVPIIAKSLEEIDSGKLDPSTIQFYVYESDVQVTKDFNRKKKINDVVAILNNLGPIEIKKVAFLLNMKMPERATYEEVYNTLDSFLHQDKKYGASDPVKEFERVTSYTPEVMNIKMLIKQLMEERIVKQSGNSIFEGSNLIAKSIEDFEIKLAEDTELYILFEDKAKSKKAYVDNI